MHDERKDKYKDGPKSRRWGYDEFSTVYWVPSSGLTIHSPMEVLQEGGLKTVKFKTDGSVENLQNLVYFIEWSKRGGEPSL